jgi:hypothetical protein
MTARLLIIGDAFVVDEIDHLPQPTDAGSRMLVSFGVAYGLLIRGGSGRAIQCIGNRVRGAVLEYAKTASVSHADTAIQSDFVASKADSSAPSHRYYCNSLRALGDCEPGTFRQTRKVRRWRTPPQVALAGLRPSGRSSEQGKCRPFRHEFSFTIAA